MTEARVRGSGFRIRGWGFGVRAGNHACRFRNRRRSRPAFSLLEVILALSILAGAVAVLGEISRRGIESTRIARDLTYAQLLCESKMAEIAAGIETTDPVDRVKIDLDDPTQSNWVYSVTSESTEINGLLAIRVTVSQDIPDERRPVHCSLVRWMADPNYEASETSSDESMQSTE